MDEEIILLVNDISAYFSKHPKAADSIEGIRRWWLNNTDDSISEKNVQNALDWLCEQGDVVMSRSSSGLVIYSRASKHTD